MLLLTSAFFYMPVHTLGFTYLPSAQSYDQISNEGVFGLPRSVTHHHTPAILLGQLTAAGARYVFSSCHSNTDPLHRVRSRPSPPLLSILHSHRDTSLNLIVVHHQLFQITVAAGWTHAWMASVTDPIWLTLSRRQLQAFSSTARSMRLGFVTVRSSPTI